MHLLHFLIKGLIIGFSIAAPVGPIGVLCIHRTLHDGLKFGLVSGMGAALADGTYGFVIGFGLTAISHFLISHTLFIKIVGGSFLIYLGLKTMLHRPPKQLTISHPNKSLPRALATTFFITLTSPMTMIVYLAVFAGLGLSAVHSGLSEAGMMVLGIIIGSMLWWVILCCGVSMFFKNRMNEARLYWINFISGLIIIVFGAIAIVSVLA